MRTFFRVEEIYDIPATGDETHGPLLETNTGFFGVPEGEKESRLLTDDEAISAGKMAVRDLDADDYLDAFAICMDMVLEDLKQEHAKPRKVNKSVPLRDADGKVLRDSQGRPMQHTIMVSFEYRKQWNLYRFMERMMEKHGWTIKESHQFMIDKEVEILEDLQAFLKEQDLNRPFRSTSLNTLVPDHYLRIRTKVSRKSRMRLLAKAMVERKGLKGI